MAATEESPQNESDDVRAKLDALAEEVSALRFAVNALLLQGGRGCPYCGSGGGVVRKVKPS